MLPGFTAENSLDKANASYRATNAYGVPTASGAVLQQALKTICSDCIGAGFLQRGTRYCCDIEITCHP